MSRYENFIEGTRPFMEWMLGWYDGLPVLQLNDVAIEPDKVAIVCVDIIKGFTEVGPLASPRIAKVVAPIAKLFEVAWGLGVRNIVLAQDAHPEDAVEFAQYGPHCIAGTEEAETVEAFKALPFFDQLEIIPKNSIHLAANTRFDDWITAHPEVTTYITVGDCSDICTYQLAMHLRVGANAAQRKGVRVIAPVNAIDTYDLPVETALEIGATPHNAELMHHVFLYHMMLNGVEVVRSLNFQT